MTSPGVASHSDPVGKDFFHKAYTAELEVSSDSDDDDNRSDHDDDDVSDDGDDGCVAYLADYMTSKDLDRLDDYPFDADHVTEDYRDYFQLTAFAAHLVRGDDMKDP